MSTARWKRSTIVKATSKATGEIRLFTTGISAARHLGCSKVLVYAVVSQSPNFKYYHSARGWSLELVDLQTALLTWPNIAIES